MKLFTRRSFVETVSFGLASMGLTTTTEAQLIYRKQDWKFPEFEKLLKNPARAKQLYDVRPIGDGKFLKVIKNSLNGLEFGFGIPKDQIKIVAGLHGAANGLNFDDAMWAKYRLGELLNVTDPATGAPAIRNIYFPRQTSKTLDLEDPNSSLQDASIQALQARGVTFLSCHNGTQEQAKELVKQRRKNESVQDVVSEMQAHILPHMIIVPAMVAAISLLQSEGHFTYITV